MRFLSFDNNWNVRALADASKDHALRLRLAGQTKSHRVDWHLSESGSASDGRHLLDVRELPYEMSTRSLGAENKEKAGENLQCYEE